MSDVRAEDVLGFWLDEVGPEGWYAGSPALDAELRERFGAAWEAAATGGMRVWEGRARGALALAILLDQMPRNMFRGEARAFATDPVVRRVADRAIRRGFDRAVEMPGRQFLYLPFEHSESVTDQERAVRLIAGRTSSAELLLHARAHRAVIRRFGRFPFRNEALGRRTTAAEAAWLEAGAYGAEVRALQGAQVG